MNEEQKRILAMLAEGKVTAEQAESLLDALKAAPAEIDATPKSHLKYLRVVVEDPVGHHHGGHGGGKVNVRVPMNLIRAGVRLAALLPSGAYDHVNKALKEHGLDLDLSQVKPENLEALVDHLSELTVDVEGNHGEKVKVYCE